MKSLSEIRPAARDLMACLGEPSRFRLVKALIRGPRCVTDLAAEVGLSQSCTTRHLQALERRSVVRGTRDGKRVLYAIRQDRADLMPLIGWAMEGRPGARRVAPVLETQAGKPRPTRGVIPALRSNGGPSRGGGPGPRPVAAAASSQDGDNRPPASFRAARPPAPPRSAAASVPRSEPSAGLREPDPVPALRRRRGELEDFLL